MLLTKEVEVKLWGHTVKYYNNLGYNGKHGDIITIKIEDLLKGSHVFIKALCDYCEEEIVEIPYCDYINSLKLVGKTACTKCRGKKQIDCNMAKYGVHSASQLDWVKEKIRITSNYKYGVDNYAKTKKCQEKMADTRELRYGYRYALQNPESQKRFKETCVARYGESYGKIFAGRAFESFYEKTGYDFPSQSPEVREKITQSYIDEYNVDNPAKSPEIKEKITKTLYANSSQKTSRQQGYICNLYQGVLNYPVKYYNVDIYLADDNLIVEYDGGGHLLNVTMGRLTQEEFDQKEIVRNNVIKREGYKQMRIISAKDKLPSDQVLLQMLSEAKEYFSNYPNHSWIEFNIDTSTVRNAEHKNGIFYDYGELRSISKSIQVA